MKRGLIVGFVIAWSLTLFAAPTVASWSAASCPVGVATLSVRATSLSSNALPQIFEAPGLTMPRALASASFSNLTQGQWMLQPSVRYQDGAEAYGELQIVDGLGDPLPTPTPTPEPPPGGGNTPQGQPVTIGGDVYSFGPNGETLKNGTHVGGGLGAEYFVCGTTLYVVDRARTVWYRLDGEIWTSIGTGKPTCSTVPAPTPPTQDNAAVLTAIADVKAAGLGAAESLRALIIERLTPPAPPPTVECAVTATNSASVTIRCTRTAFPLIGVGATVKVVK